MITPSANRRLVARLSTLPFFPTKPDAIEVVIEAVMEFAATDDEVDWLGRQMVAHFKAWPGVHEMRGVFCTRFKPADGLEAESETFPRGCAL